MGKMKLKLIPSCTQQPRTVSFRSTTTITTTKKVDNDVYKTINSVYNNYFDPEPDSVETPESWFTHSSESSTSTITSTAAEYYDSSSSSHLEAIIRGAQRSTTDQRLFFMPGGETSSIMSDPESSPRLKSIICSDTLRNLTSFISERKEVEIAPTFLSPPSKRESPSPKLKIEFDSSDVRSRTSNSRERQKVERAPTFLSSPSKDASSMMMAMESEDPYNDFKTSMEEMVESLGVRDDDWEELEELLGWYLKVNGKSTHGYIVQAFVDLIVHGFEEAVIGAKKDNTTNNHDQDYNENSKSATSFSSAASSLSSSSPVSTSAQLLEEDSDHFVC